MGFVTFEKLGMFGSLGNQMFQLAATISYGASFDLMVRIPKRDKYFETSYGRDVQYIDQGLDLLPNYLEEDSIFHTFKEPNFSYSEPPRFLGNVSLEGYFQSYKYFERNQGLISYKFTNFKPEIQSQITNIATQLPHNKLLTAIHVRRGDYVNKQEYHTLLGLDYYREAKEKVGGDQHYVVFSDDIPWCQANFPDDHFFVESGDPFVDLGVMIACDNFIIANSSFSWWGAWLAWNESKKIIAPKQWFGHKNSHLSTKDLIPESWIQI